MDTVLVILIFAAYLGYTKTLEYLDNYHNRMKYYDALAKGLIVRVIEEAEDDADWWKRN